MARPSVKRVRAIEFLLSGKSANETARLVGVHRSVVGEWAKTAGVRLQRGRKGGLIDPIPEAPDGFVDAQGRLRFEARVLIGLRVREGWSQTRIAAEIGVHRSTVCREIQRGRYEGSLYRARLAHARSRAARKRPKPGKLDTDSVLRAEVVARLNTRHSPEQIAGALRVEFAGREEMQVSHETIYQALYVQGAGGLRHELTVEKATRQGRKSRRPQSKLPARTNRSWIGKGVMLVDRPADAVDRAVPGHWEGDLVIGGGDQRSALITLNERRSRFTLVSRIDVHDSATVTSRIAQMIAGLPGAVQTMTWDQGVEMAEHAAFTIATGCKVYFCDPHSPWQRPTNENSNGLIRDYYPKGTNFATVSDHDIAVMQDQLNSRPRKVLGFRTPAAILAETLNVALTD